jgi:hypothetical protein
MVNPVLNKDQLAKAAALLEKIGNDLAALAGDDPSLLFAYRRKITKELTYQERSSPVARRKLKAAKRHAQNGQCERCKQPLPDRYAVLDRFNAADGYSSQNTRLICEKCDREVQQERRYK